MFKCLFVCLFVLAAPKAESRDIYPHIISSEDQYNNLNKLKMI